MPPTPPTTTPTIGAVTAMDNNAHQAQHYRCLHKQEINEKQQKRISDSQIKKSLKVQRKERNTTANGKKCKRTNKKQVDVALALQRVDGTARCGSVGRCGSGARIRVRKCVADTTHASYATTCQRKMTSEFDAYNEHECVLRWLAANGAASGRRLKTTRTTIKSIRNTKATFCGKYLTAVIFFFIDHNALTQVMLMRVACNNQLKCHKHESLVINRKCRHIVEVKSEINTCLFVVKPLSCHNQRDMYTCVHFNYYLIALLAAVAVVISR